MRLAKWIIDFFLYRLILIIKRNYIFAIELLIEWFWGNSFWTRVLEYKYLFELDLIFA